MSGDTSVKVENSAISDIGYSYDAYLWIFMVHPSDRTNYLNFIRTNL